MQLPALSALASALGLTLNLVSAQRYHLQRQGQNNSSLAEKEMRARPRLVGFLLLGRRDLLGLWEWSGSALVGWC